MKILFYLPAMVVVVLSWVNFSVLDAKVDFLKDTEIISCFLKHQPLFTALTTVNPNKPMFLITCVAYVTHTQQSQQNWKFNILLIREKV